MTNNKTDLKETAHVFARNGVKVVPCHFLIDGKCSCGKVNCKKPGKHPRTQAGVLSASTNESLINAWWSPWNLWPDSNIGVITELPLGFFVISPTKAEWSTFT